jgi:molecular chaperone DnaK (HSP70)
MAAQYVVGIDLGTTNTVLAYTPLNADQAQVQLLPIPQLVAPRTVEALPWLPSFLYLATSQEAESHLYDLPWSNQNEFAVGEGARRHAAEVPERSVGAAKSWLCHSHVDRHQPILPWKAPEHVAKVSPVTASQRYLEHLVATWHQAFPDAPIAQQFVVLTVPASFDASARELTREAALAAGLPDSLLLLEEPQAATYAWLAEAADRWRRLLHVNDRLLVCDIGGGTTDLTLVEVTEQASELQLERKAVGNHLLVGGDNMDLALAYHVAERFREKGIELDPWQSVALWHSCRVAKETLLSEHGPETHPVAVLGRGSRLIGGTVSVDVPRQEVFDLLVNGFFARCQLTDRPARSRVSGFQEMGLPFEADTAVTRHLAAFLQRQGTDGQRPTHVLFNGGVFKAAPFQQALMTQLGDWFRDAPPKILEGTHDLDFAVARGAAYYGWSKRQGGVRIRGGTARSYYVGIETAGLAIPGAPRPLRALCVVPQRMEEGTEADVPSDDIGLVVGEAAKFHFFSSATRKEDRPGTVLRNWSADEVVETDSLEATLSADGDTTDESVPVRFHSRITELGMFELWCVASTTGQRWKLEFSVREDADS